MLAWLFRMDPLEFGSEDQVKKGHPAIVATHVGFRGAAIFLYMFGSVGIIVRHRN